MFNPGEKIIIVAMTPSRVIGRGNAIPWHISQDLKLFKEATVGHAVIMGRKTFESMGRPLSNRHNIVVSKNFSAQPGITVCGNFDEALRAAEGDNTAIFFIGGSTIYEQALALADYLLISWVKGEYEGDTYFPDYDATAWEPIEEHDYSEFKHVLYRKKMI